MVESNWSVKLVESRVMLDSQTSMPHVSETLLEFINKLDWNNSITTASIFENEELLILKFDSYCTKINFERSNI